MRVRVCVCVCVCVNIPLCYTSTYQNKQLIVLSRACISASISVFSMSLSTITLSQCHHDLPRLPPPLFSPVFDFGIEYLNSFWRL